MLLTPAEGFFLREKHIARLLDSASYFDFSISPQPRWSRRGGMTQPLLPKEIIETYLNEISSQFISPQRVRVLLDKDGKLNFEAKSFQPVLLSSPPRAYRICLAKEPIDSGNVFLYHKTTQREVYDSARKDFPDCDDVLLYNEKSELAEFTIGNLVVAMDDKLFTPPLACGLLPRVFRAHLLETNQATVRII